MDRKNIANAQIDHLPDHLHHCPLLCRPFQKYCSLYDLYGPQQSNRARLRAEYSWLGARQKVHCRLPGR